MAKTVEPRIQSHAGEGPRPGILVGVTSRGQRQTSVLPEFVNPGPRIHWPAVAIASGCALLFLAGLVAAVTLTSPKKITRLTTVAQPPILSPTDTDVASDGLLDTPPPSLPPPTSSPESFKSEAAEPAPPALAKAAAKPSGALAPPVPEPEKEPAPPAAPRPFKQRKHRSPDELARALLAVPELTLDAVSGTSTKLVFAARQPTALPAHATTDFLVKRTDLAGLPFRMGLECQTGKESAENLQVLSRKLRGYLTEAVPKDGLDVRLDADVLRAKLLEGRDGKKREWLRPEAVPALVQLLQAEDRPIRLLLVEVLALNKDRGASVALAQRAVFDLACDVREAAVRALKERPRDEYYAILLEGLHYPWVAAADHAAEAIAFLGDGEAVPALVDLLDDADHSAKVGKSQVPVVRELVRVNHLKNCLMCHAASANANDPVRGLIPTPGQPLPPSFSPAYYQGTNGLFVRADVTYLKQDFSVPQPVARPETWPVNQRYDYLVRKRPVTIQEAIFQPKKPADSPQREAVLFALRELTGKDAGPTSAGWRRLMAQAMVAKIKE